MNISRGNKCQKFVVKKHNLKPALTKTQIRGCTYAKHALKSFSIVKK